MKRLLLMIVALFILTACASETLSPAVSTTTAPPEPETAVPTKSTADDSGETAVDAAAPSGFPAKDAAEASIVRERDWKKGAEDPAVTIIEYGDFQ